MFGANRSGFDWKEIAEALRVTAAAPTTFWRELRRSRSKKLETLSPATVIEGEREPEPGSSATPKHPLSRREAVSSVGISHLGRTARLPRGKRRTIGNDQNGFR